METPKRRREFFFFLRQQAKPRFIGFNLKVTAETKYSGRNHFFTNIHDKVIIGYEIKLYQKIIRFVAELLTEF